jgi:hypothetical protein
MPEDRKELETRLSQLQQEREVVKEAYLKAPMDKEIAAQRIADVFANKRAIDDVKRQLKSTE